MPNGDRYEGVVNGRPSKGARLHMLESSDERHGSEQFPFDRQCARVVHFADGEILHLSLPMERKAIHEDGRCPFGYWRRVNRAPRIGGKKRATSLTDIFSGSAGAAVQSSKNAVKGKLR